MFRAYLDAANAGDADAALACWAEGGTYTVLPAALTGQSVFTGKAQSRSLVEALVAERFRADVKDLRVEGEHVSARARSTLERFRRLGIDALEANAEAIVRDGHIQSATCTFTPKGSYWATMARPASSFVSARVATAIHAEFAVAQVIHETKMLFGLVAAGRARHGFVGEAHCLGCGADTRQTKPSPIARRTVQVQLRTERAQRGVDALMAQCELDLVEGATERELAKQRARLLALEGLRLNRNRG